MAFKVDGLMRAVLVLMVMVWSGARAQTSTCTGALTGLAPCLNFVTGNSTSPAPACCSQLATVVQTQPRCLCSLLNGNVPNIGITINQTLAVTLPGACNVQTPPISLCNVAANGPASEPATAPTSSAIAPTDSTESPTEETPEVKAPTAPLTPTAPSGTGSKATPSTNNNASSGSKFGPSSYFLLLVFVVGMKL